MRAWIGLLCVCAVVSGCLLNSVHAITRAPRTNPDSAHAIVVIGMGLDNAWPYTEFPVTLAEYSVEKQQITGNCFHYNRIEADVPPIPAEVRYFAFEVPANIYVYLGLGPKLSLAPSSATAFVAPPGGVVYFGDYVFDGDAVEFRQNIEAARITTPSPPPCAHSHPPRSSSAPCRPLTGTSPRRNFGRAG